MNGTVFETGKGANPPMKVTLKQIAEENTLSVHEDGVADYIRRKLPNQ